LLVAGLLPRSSVTAQLYYPAQLYHPAAVLLVSLPRSALITFETEFSN
jgi:hypothetical protein